MSEVAANANANSSGDGSGSGSGNGNANGTIESSAEARKSAPKDRCCPYCGQAFTSSSLGRHLDLYIKEKNPKAPDGIHDVEAIRKLRGSITRRQPRGSLTRRDASTPGTPTASSSTSTKKSPLPDQPSRGQGLGPAPAVPKDGQFVVDHQVSKYPFQPTWEATGVINDIPSNSANGTANANGDLRASWDESVSQDSSTTATTTTRPGPPRVPSRVTQKAQLDARQRLADTMDTARAAELALRELLGSWRAAKQHIDMNSMPFDFDPLSLDFPALTLQCLQAPPTLFSSTPHSTSTSWSIQPPAQKQYEALRGYFEEEFRKWRVACATTTTATSEDLTYPPSNAHFPQDIQENVRRAEQAAASLERQIDEHLHSTYHVWEQLSAQRKSELWGLELARGVGRRQKDVERLKEANRLLKQECANLKAQVEQLNRLQQPREFRIMPPATIPFEESLIRYWSDLGSKGHRGVGLGIDDRHVDLNMLVSRAIERWKAVIVSSRGVGMAAQRSLDQTTPTPTPTSATAPPAPNSALGSKHTQPGGQLVHQPTVDTLAGSNNGQSRPAATSSTTTTTTTPAAATTTPASLANEDNSDQDADAEMDEDDHFEPTPVISKPTPHPQQQQLELPRTQVHNPLLPSTTDGRFAVNGNNAGTRGSNARQPMPNMNSAAVVQGHTRNPHGPALGLMNNGDYGPVVPTGGSGDPMYMD
ncbi:hypothetical protein DL771_002090 [Monosporascus sp. 5C6A]|nr:hypothetical protein DL771_002090 [Monosporascus sp. 5C6A]